MTPWTNNSCVCVYRNMKKKFSLASLFRGFPHLIPFKLLQNRLVSMTPLNFCLLLNLFRSKLKLYFRLQVNFFVLTMDYGHHSMVTTVGGVCERVSHPFVTHQKLLLEKKRNILSKTILYSVIAWLILLEKCSMINSSFGNKKNHGQVFCFFLYFHVHWSYHSHSDSHKLPNLFCLFFMSANSWQF